PRPWPPLAPAGPTPRAALIGGATRLALVADRVVELVLRDPQVDPRVDVLQLRRYAIVLDDAHVGRRGAPGLELCRHDEIGRLVRFAIDAREAQIRDRLLVIGVGRRHLHPNAALETHPLPHEVALVGLELLDAHARC